jgi:hypothetical protein
VAILLPRLLSLDGNDDAGDGRAAAGWHEASPRLAVLVSGCSSSSTLPPPHGIVTLRCPILLLRCITNVHMIVASLADFVLLLVFWLHLDKDVFWNWVITVLV